MNRAVRYHDRMPSPELWTLKIDGLRSMKTDRWSGRPIAKREYAELA
jgi:hypothetical protein